eukprot:2094921-Prymnesium_polylepis.1
MKPRGRSIASASTRRGHHPSCPRAVKRLCRHCWCRREVGQAKKTRVLKKKNLLCRVNNYGGGPTPPAAVLSGGPDPPAAI